MKVDLEQLEEMQKELFKQQCDLDIQKEMVKHFIKKEKAKQLTLTDVVPMLKDKEVITFEEWLEIHNYTKVGENTFIARNGQFTFKEVNKFYNDWVLRTL